MGLSGFARRLLDRLYCVSSLSDSLIVVSTFYERGLLSCDTQIVCVYEATCSVVERLIVSVDVEKDGGQDNCLWQAVLLISLAVTLIVQFHIKPPTGQHVLDYST